MNTVFWKRMLFVAAVAVPTVPVVVGAIMVLFYGAIFTTVVPSSAMDNVQRLEDTQAASNAKAEEVYVTWGAGDLLPDPNRDGRDPKPDQKCKDVARKYIGYQVAYWAAVAMPSDSTLFKGASGMYSRLESMEYQEECLNYDKHPEMVDYQLENIRYRMFSSLGGRSIEEQWGQFVQNNFTANMSVTQALEVADRLIAGWGWWQH